MIQNTVLMPTHGRVTLPSLMRRARLRAALELCLGKEDVTAGCISKGNKSQLVAREKSSRREAMPTDPSGRTDEGDTKVSLVSMLHDTPFARLAGVPS